MAIRTYVGLLKQSIANWNAWRRENSGIVPDLIEANLSMANLVGVDLSVANLSVSILSGADLSNADLSGAGLRGADLKGAKLCKANLVDADLIDADLRGADLRNADLRKAKLIDTDLRRADLSSADLRGADLSSADLRGADLRKAKMDYADLDQAVLGGTHFAFQNLMQVQHIETIRHRAPSFIGLTTVMLPLLSSGLITFLRGAGQSPYLIAALQGTELPLASVSVNIIVSYIESDKEFADGLRPHLALLKSVTLVEEAVPLSSQEPWQRNAEVYEIAHLMIVLVSAPFLASPIVKKQILEPGFQQVNKGTSLVPVIVRPVDWQESLLKELQPVIQGQPVTRWSDRDEALHAIAQDLQPIVQHLYTTLLEEASRQRQRDLLLAQFIQVRTTCAEQRGEVTLAQRQVHEVSKAVASAEKRLQDAQKDLQDAQEVLHRHGQREREAQQHLITLQQTETNLLARINELNVTPHEQTSARYPSA